eukprot:g77327.t1
MGWTRILQLFFGLSKATMILNSNSSTMFPTPAGRILLQRFHWHVKKCSR